MHIVTCPRFTRWFAMLTIMWVLLPWIGSQPVQAQRFTSLHSFDAYPDGSTPTGPLVIGPDGAFYGVANSGGESDAGNVFRVTAGGEFSTLYSFTGRDDGSSPFLLVSGHGSFYGLTANTLFSVTADGALTTLHRFTYPDSAQVILLGRDGRLYGVSSNGGAGQNGYIFSVGTDGSQFTTLYTFTGGLDSAGPTYLIQGIDGRLYGTAGGGGALPYGSVFHVDVSGMNFTTTYAFGYTTDGDTPDDLVQGADGTLYGATADGGLNDGGTVFRMAPDGSAFATLTSLDFFKTGYSPQGLTFGPDGALYGFVYYGGKAGAGGLFKIGLNGKGFRLLYSFTGTDEGGGPEGLTLGPDGLFFGTAAYGGAGRGTLFSATPTGVVSPVFALAGNSDGAFPTDIRRASDGNSYGVTYYGGIYDAGTVFRVTAAGDTDTLYSFTGGNDGAGPVVAPILGKDGYLYGTVAYGGPNGTGVIYKLSPAGSISVVHAFSAENPNDYFDFTNADGVQPNGLVQASDGYLYGTAFEGGNDGSGTVFRVAPNGTGFKVLHTFTDGKDQGLPYGSMIVGKDGSVYGTASGYDNSYNTRPTYGSVFKVAPDGRFTTLCVFTDPTVAAIPSGALVQGPDGTLYGAADYTQATSSSYGFGSIFAIKPDGSGLKNVYLFTGANGSAYPFGLILNTDGLLYGISGYGASGPLFSVGTDGKGYKVDYLFRNSLLGIVPAAITAVGDGSLIGATEYGGAKGIGTVFHFKP